jgi:hypothetical protein
VRLRSVSVRALLVIDRRGEKKLSLMHDTDDLEIFAPRFQIALKSMLLG